MFEHYFLLLSVTLNFCYIFLIVPDKNHRIEVFKNWFSSYRNDIDSLTKKNLELENTLDTWKFLAKQLQDELDEKQ